jgi:hypothetical protein
MCLSLFDAIMQCCVGACQHWRIGSSGNKKAGSWAAEPQLARVRAKAGGSQGPLY